MDRRSFLASLGAGAAACLAGGPIALAAADTDRRLVLFVLRGALDGLAAVPVPGDPAFAAVRGSLAPTGALPLDGTFALHPALAPIAPLWGAGELAVVHATCTPYGDRSHFDGQNVLENGTATPFGTSDGWLNRAVGALGGGPLPVAVGRTVPLVLRGAAPATSADPTRAPRVDPRWLDDVHALLDRDPVLGPALAAGIETEALLAPLRPPAAPRDRTRGDRDGDGDGDREREGDGDGAAVLGRMLAADGGPRIAVVERGGWDTHTAQDRTLTQGLDGLARSIAGLRDGLGDRWADTVVVAATEFGRTVRGNGTGGTDHGTGGVALLAGGAVAGGRVVADWPGLDDGALLDGRDLRPTTDLRRVFAGILRDHLRVPERALRGVFPGGVAPLDGLVRVG